MSQFSTSTFNQIHKSNFMNINNNNNLNNSLQIILRIRPDNQIENNINNKFSYKINPIKNTISIQNEKSYTFNKIYSSSSKQNDIFINSIKSLCDQYLNGKNVTLLSYGQNQSGKTFTLFGQNLLYKNNNVNNKNINNNNFNINNAIFEKGIIFYVIEYIFLQIDNKKIKNINELNISFIENVNENNYDLFESKSNNNYNKNNNNNNNVIVNENYIKITIKSYLDFIGILKNNFKFNNNNIKKDFNESNLIFSISYETDNNKYIYFNLVKLISSEKKSNNNNNFKTLSVLNNVIYSLLNNTINNQFNTNTYNNNNINNNIFSLNNNINSNKKQYHIPYRDSKLTYSLRHSLTINSKIMFIFNIFPTCSNFIETLSTLNYSISIKKTINNNVNFFDINNNNNNNNSNNNTNNNISYNKEDLIR